MRYAVLGTGQVGATLASRLVQLGHEVRMGARQAGGEKATAWVRSAGDGASEGTFADAASFGEVVLNATAGQHSLDALQAAGAGALRGKVLVDVANPLTFEGGAPGLTVCNTDSLGEQIQRAFPDTRVVKTLNTMNCEVMADPSLVPGEHTVFVSGNDSTAKAAASEMLQSFGWPASSLLDLGGIETARGTEMYVMAWVRMRLALGTSHFNVQVCRGA